MTLLRRRGVGAAAGGAAAATVVPDDLSGLAVWYRAEDETYANNDPAEATDQSGNARHATQATSGKRPLWIADGLGGKPVWRFDGTDDLLQSATFGPLSQPNTLVLIGSISTLPGTGSFPLVDGANSTQRHYFGLSDAAPADDQTWRMFAGAWSWDDNQPKPHTGPFALACVYDGASSKLYDRGMLARTGNPSTQACGGLTLGGRNDDAQHVAYDLAELALYSRALTASELADLELYAAVRYGFAVTFVSAGDYPIDGNKWAYGVKASTGDVYATPFDRTNVLKVDPAAETSTTFGTLTGTSKWIGLVEAGNGNLYGIPEDATNVLKVDPSTDTASTFGSGLGSYYGGVLASNGAIYAAPFEDDDVLKIDPSTDTTSTVTLGGGGLGANRYGWLVEAGNGNLYGIPRNATSVLKVDPSTDTASTFGTLSSSTRKWVGGVLVGTRIYCVPRDATSVLVIETADDTTYEITGIPSGDDKWNGSVWAADGHIWLTPRRRNDFLVIDPSDDSWELFDAGIACFANTNKWIGAAEITNSRFLLVPHNHPTAAIGTLL